MVQDEGSPTAGSSASINLMILKPGQRLKLIGEIVAEVVENPLDGESVRVLFLTVPAERALEGIEDRIFAQDVLGLAD